MHQWMVPLLSLYVSTSLFLTLRFAWWIRVLLILPLLLGGCKALILDFFWPGMTFFLPEAPRFPLMLGSALFVFMVIALCLIAIRDLCALITWLFQRCGKWTSISLYVVAVGATCWSMWDSMRVPDVKEVTIEVDGLNPDYKGFTIAVLADLHLAQLNDKSYAEEIVRRTNALNADIIVLPGDLIDGDIELRRETVAPLAGLKAKYGVFASAGNHEYYSGYHTWMAEFRRLGMKTLENENVEILPGLFIAGVGDVAAHMDISHDVENAEAVDFPKAMQGTHGTVIMLAHRPDLAKYGAKSGVDLQIAGHTHGGMLWGFNQLVAYFNGGYVSGLYEVHDRMKLYVSNGAGLWPGFTMRVGISGEITLITLD